MSIKRRQFKLKGQNRSFAMYGYGFEKDKVKHWAELIRQRGFRARVVPLSRDKVMGKGRYGLFIHPKSDNRIRWNDGQWAGMNSWQTLGDGISKRTISSTMPDGTKTEAYLLRLPQMNDYRTSRQFFSGATSDVGVRVFNKEKDEDELERLVREQLGMTKDEIINIQDEATFFEENKEEWWEDDYYSDPTKGFSFEELQKNQKSIVDATQARTAVCDSCGAGIRFEGDCPGKFGGRCATDVPEDEIDDYYADEEEDAYMSMMDAVGYNDSAYKSLSPMVMLGYDGGYGGEAISEKEFDKYIRAAEKYNEKHMKNAQAFLSGSGRFGEFNEFVEEFGEPESVGDVIALPLVTVKGRDENLEERKDQPLGINEILTWFIHPDAISSLNNQSRIPKAETAFIDSFGGMYGGEEVFQDSQANNLLFMMDERIGEWILNAEDELNNDMPEIVAVGTDIGFFNRQGELLGIRLTPFDSQPGVQRFPKFMRDLFENRSQETGDGLGAISQLFYREQQIWGNSTPHDSSDLDSYEESENLSVPLDDYQRLSKSEFSMIYSGDGNLVSKDEALFDLQQINELNIDERIEIEDFRRIIGARANLSDEDYKAELGLQRYANLYSGED